MAIRKDRDFKSLATTATNVTFAFNTSGIDLAGILITNTHPSNQIQAFVSVVATGSIMASGNYILSSIGIGPSGMLNVSVPLFMASGDSLQASGSAAGLNLYSSFLRLN